MSYFICAWVEDSNIKLLETDTMPIVENHAPTLACDVRITGEVSGEYQQASEVIGSLSFDGNQLVGLDFVNQTPDP